MKFLFAFLVFTFVFSFSLFGCQCDNFKPFLRNIKNADLVVFGEVISFKYEKNGLSRKIMKIKVENSFGANIVSDTIRIRQGSGIDCSLSIDFFNKKDKVYFLLNYDSSNYNQYIISECGETFLRITKNKRFAYGTVNTYHNLIRKIFKINTGKIKLKKLNKMLYKKCKKLYTTNKM